MKDKCIAPGCKRKAEVKKHKLCRTHVQRLYRTGAVGKHPISKRESHQPYKPNA